MNNITHHGHVSSAIPAATGLRCLRRLPMAVAHASRPSLCALPYQLAWVTRTAPVQATARQNYCIGVQSFKLDWETKTVGFDVEVHVD
jgi:hypothetical protein